MTVSTVPLTDTFDQWRIKFNEVVVVQNAQISDVARASLTTTATDIVPAINEVKAVADAAATDVTGKVDKSGDTMTGNLILDAAVGIDLSSTSAIKNSTGEILLDEDGVGPDQVPLDAHRTGTFDSLLGFNGSGTPEYVLKNSLGADIDVIDLNDTPASYTGFAGFHLAVTGAEDGIEFVAAGGGTYISLTDTPGSFTSDAYKAVRVSGASNALVHAGTGAVLMDSGTTAQRPGSAVNGMIRYNSSNNEMEAFENGVWGPLGGGGLIDEQFFTSSGTWTKPAGTTKVRITVIGGGGGGAGAGVDGGGGGTSSFGAHASATGSAGGAASSGDTNEPAVAGGVGVSGDANIEGSSSENVNQDAGGLAEGGGGGGTTLGGSTSSNIASRIGANFGGGGGGTSAGSGAGTGGGGGGTALKFIDSGLGATETITIGAAGTAGTGAGVGAKGIIIVKSYA